MLVTSHVNIAVLMCLHSMPSAPGALPESPVPSSNVCSNCKASNVEPCYDNAVGERHVSLLYADNP